MRGARRGEGYLGSNVGNTVLCFAENEILVRTGKGAKDRITMLPASLKSPLQDHLKKVKAIHKRDLADGWGCVLMPDALDRKYPNDPGASRP
jgi:hypothetical protein